MKDMVTDTESSCPFAGFDFNTDPGSFKPGDLVAYRVPDLLEDMPFPGELLEVHVDHVILKHYQAASGDDRPMRGTLEANPIVSKKDLID